MKLVGNAQKKDGMRTIVGFEFRFKKHFMHRCIHLQIFWRCISSTPVRMASFFVHIWKMCLKINHTVRCIQSCYWQPNMDSCRSFSFTPQKRFYVDNIWLDQPKIERYECCCLVVAKFYKYSLEYSNSLWKCLHAQMQPEHGFRYV